MRILVVDDDRTVRNAVRVMLEEAGMEISEATNGAEALRALRRHGADVVLCDLFMPEQDGMEFLRELRPRSSGVRVVAMSGGGNFHGTVDLLPVARFLGAVAVLPKPFNQHELRAAIADAVREQPSDSIGLAAG
jgi:DNA-binding NtrC family response regulator